jgi:NAD(P)-dependent dehydrogenase (short-subunit alcohol dehydrogenase family)
MASPLLGLRVLITGGSSGIGAATARALAAEGSRVAIAGRDRIALAKVSADTGAVCVPGDLCQPGCPRQTVATASQALDGLDVLVSNAGIGWAGSFTTMTEADIDRLIDVNLRAATHLARAAIPALAPGGRLVFVGSIAGLVGSPGEACYSATKAGLSCLAETLRSELRPRGLGVTLVSPGVVDTPFFERRQVPYARQHPQLMSPQTAADAIVDAIRRRRDNVVIPSWLSFPARLKGNFPGLYRLLETRFA